MITRRYFLLCFLTVQITIYSHSQVNLQTGAAEYTLPLYSYSNEGNRLSTSLDLTYVAGNGVRNDHAGTIVGTGWILGGGGVIERMQNGVADDQFQSTDYGNNPYNTTLSGFQYLNYYYPNGYMFSEEDPSVLVKNIGAYIPQIDENVIDPRYKQLPMVLEDREIDIYSFSFNGRTGSFVIGKDGNVRLLDESKMKISKVLTDMTAQNIITRISEFHILDEFGIRYVFKDLYLAELLEFRKVDATTITRTGSSNGELIYMTSLPRGKYTVQKWFLSEVVNSLTNEKIEFQYEEYYLDLPGSKTAHYSSNVTTLTVDRIRGESKRLKKLILPDDESVELIYDESDRQDASAEKALMSINVVKGSKILYSWNYSYGYFVKNEILSYGTSLTQPQKYKARLALLSVEKKGSGLEVEPPYEFSYYLGEYLYKYKVDGVEYQQEYNLEVSPLNSFYNDHHGFYNRKGQQVDGDFLDENRPLTITSAFNSQFPTVAGSGSIDWDRLVAYTVNLYGSERNVYGLNAIAGALKSVKNPYGGTLTFEYDLRVGFNGSTEAFSGGIGVTKVTTNDGEGTAFKQEYHYIKEDGSSSGWGNEVNTYSFSGQQRIYRCDDGKKPARLIIDGVSKAGSFLFTKPSYLLTKYGSISYKGAKVQALHSLVIWAIFTIIEEFILPDFTERNSTEYSTVSPQSMNGVPFGYSRVEVESNNATESLGKTVYEFTSDSDYPFLVSNLAIPNSRRIRFASWSYGLPKSVTNLNASGQPVKRKDFFYNRILNELVEENVLSQSWKPTRTVFGCDFMPGPDYYYLNELMSYDTYYPISGRTELVKTEDRAYNDLGESALSEVTYTYSPSNFMVSKVNSENSLGEIVEVLNYYPTDYEVSGAIAIMNEGGTNMVGIPVSSFTWIKNSSNEKVLIGGSVNEYGLISNGDIKVKKKYGLRTDSPLPENIAAFNSTTLLPFPNLQKLAEFEYNLKGFPYKVKSESMVSSTLYDYAETYPVANIANAESTDVYYTSFETSNSGGWLITGNWTYSSNGVTGSRSLMSDASGLAKLEALVNPDRRYKLSFWFKGAVLPTLGSGYNLLKQTFNDQTGYVYLEYILQGLSTVVISNSDQSNSTYEQIEIDELRLYPEEASISTKTYDPGIGITSVCDENGRIVYYEYDSFGRIVFERDDRLNILKRVCYNYKGQTGNCDNYFYFSKAKQKALFKNNCEAGFSPTAQVVYTVPAGRYSSTLSQLDADSKAQADADANAQSYANSNGTCSFDGCNFVSAGSGYLGENAMSRVGNEVTFFLHAYNLANTNWTVNPVLIATVSGYCKPLTTSFSTTFTESGRLWRIMITPPGEVLLLFLSGPAPSNGIAVHVPSVSFTIE